MITIRQATVADTAAVPLIYSSGPEMFDFLFSRYGRSALEFIQRCFLSGKGLYGYPNQIVAEVDGEVLGSMTLYSGVEVGALDKQMLGPLLKYYGPFNLMRMVRDIAATEKWIVPPNKSTDYLANLGVAPAARGLGIGTALLQHGLVCAEGRGKTTYALDVVETNPDAERLYCRFGMQRQWEKTYPRSATIPQAHRLSMAVPERNAA